MVLVQFRVPKKQADALARVQHANGKTEADVLRDAVTWYLGSPHVHHQLKFGQLMQAIEEGKLDLAEFADGPPIEIATPKPQAVCPCGSGKKFARCCELTWPKMKGAA